MPKGNNKAISMQAERREQAAIVGKTPQITQEQKIKTSMIMVCIDNKNAIVKGSTVRTGDGPFRHLKEDYNLQSKVFETKYTLLKQHGIEVRYKHVYSHMEEKEKAAKLKKKYGTEGYVQFFAQTREQAINKICEKEAEKG